MSSKIYIYFDTDTRSFIFLEHKKAKKKYLTFSREDLMMLARKNISNARHYIVRHKLSSSFLHFSTHVISRININTEEERLVSIYRKPPGLWVSLGNSWLDYVDQLDDPNKYNLFTYVYKIELYSNVKIITDKDSLFSFIKKYKKKPDDIRIYDIIDWSKVKADFTGLIITPHLGTRIWRDNYRSFEFCGIESVQDFINDLLGSKWKNNNMLLAEWYRAWTCAGGVIWSTDAIASFKLVKKMDYLKYIA